jgi:hypothetical protein
MAALGDFLAALGDFVAALGDFVAAVVVVAAVEVNSIEKKYRFYKNGCPW